MTQGKISEEQYRHEMHMIELDEQAFQALRNLCFEKHKKHRGVGVAAMCVCGWSTQSGSIECRALREIWDWWPGERERRIEAAQKAYTDPS